MRLLQWCMLGVTILLLVCEVTISQLCTSLITLVDGFHTLFILLCMALPASKNVSSIQTPTPPADSPIEPLPVTQPGSEGPTVQGRPPTPQPGPEAASLVNPDRLPRLAPDCGVSYTNSRMQPVGAFMSTLLLASLCISYLIQIISFSLEPHPVQRPLLLVVVGAVSAFHKMLLLRLNWDQLREDRAGGHRQPEASSLTEAEHTGKVGCSVSQ